MQTNPRITYAESLEIRATRRGSQIVQATQIQRKGGETVMIWYIDPFAFHFVLKLIGL